MENDSPNLFDSEPVPVTLTAADPDDVLAEIVGEIHAGDGPANAEIPVDDESAEIPVNDERTEIPIDDATAADYRTDESDDENEDAVEDQSVGEQSEDPAKSKTRDAHKGLPPGRVKLIMKMDPDVNIVAGDAVFLLTKATESFVALLAQHCHKAMVTSNKKTLKKQHIDAVIEENIPFEFLAGALDW